MPRLKHKWKKVKSIDKRIVKTANEIEEIMNKYKEDQVYVRKDKEKIEQLDTLLKKLMSQKKKLSNKRLEEKYVFNKHQLVAHGRDFDAIKFPNQG